MNYFHTSTGQRVSKSVVDYRVRMAKKKKLEQQFEEHGYNFCTECFNNYCKPIDCSHIISVDECQKSGRTELAWDLINIKILGRKCHRIYDKLNIQSSKIKV